MPKPWALTAMHTYRSQAPQDRARQAAQDPDAPNPLQSRGLVSRRRGTLLQPPQSTAVLQEKKGKPEDVITHVRMLSRGKELIDEPGSRPWVVPESQLYANRILSLCLMASWLGRPRLTPTSDLAAQARCHNRLRHDRRWSRLHFSSVSVLRCQYAYATSAEMKIKTTRTYPNPTRSTEKDTLVCVEPWSLRAAAEGHAFDASFA